jgi:hypothetical protein
MEESLTIYITFQAIMGFIAFTAHRSPFTVHLLFFVVLFEALCPNLSKTAIAENGLPQ